MPAIIEIEVTGLLDGRLDLGFSAHQVGHLSPGEDQYVRSMKAFFGLFNAALHAKAERENKNLGTIDADMMAEIVEKAMKNGDLDETKGKAEYDISDDVTEFGGPSKN